MVLSDGSEVVHQVQRSYYFQPQWTAFRSSCAVPQFGTLFARNLLAFLTKYWGYQNSKTFGKRSAVTMFSKQHVMSDLKLALQMWRYSLIPHNASYRNGKSKNWFFRTHYLWGCLSEIDPRRRRKIQKSVLASSGHFSTLLISSIPFCSLFKDAPCSCSDKNAEISFNVHRGRLDACHSYYLKKYLSIHSC